MTTKKGTPKRDGSGKGIGSNHGRGGCKPTEKKGLKASNPKAGGRNRI